MIILTLPVNHLGKRRPKPRQGFQGKTPPGGQIENKETQRIEEIRHQKPVTANKEMGIRNAKGWFDFEVNRTNYSIL